ncbi:MAG TPA: histidine kinase [Thermobifida alba]|uniref:histidine kinase n=1 Tax=Thermobifida cellulosilytica TB100 TaxID=665004 RepID=A0A147KDU6_THECS|nr:histidine kinase [Thermobifida cellulosilytica]KUP95455.1 hypothetical protein AC529_17560 [Thermobifida cellulosilytica TB100]HLU98159.1 histidine kinase [Thermobifida alba]
MRERWPGRAGRPVPRAAWAADLVLWAVLTGVLAAELAGVRAAPTAETAVMALLLAVAFGVRRKRPLTALGLTVGAGVLHSAAVAVGMVDVFTPTYVLPSVVLAFLAGRRDGRAAPVVVLTVTAALTMLSALGAAWASDGDPRAALTGLTDWAGGVLVLIAAVVAPWLLGRYQKRHAQWRTAGWEIAARMERARAGDAERARLRERSRIATEMHDSLGHDLALIAVRAAALEMTSEEEGTRAAASELRVAAHQATLRLREIIGVLRGEDGTPAAEPAAETAADVVARAVDAGMPVRLVREGPDPDPATPAGRAVHRVVQEALTNAARHAPGARVEVRIVREDGTTTVRVADTGGFGAGAAGNGSGLAGLRALVEGMGGAFEAGPDRCAGAAGGFTVTARIPETADAGGATAPAEEPAGEATETARHWNRMRDSARRRLAAALVVPSGLAVAVTVLGFLTLWYAEANTVLPRADYDRLRVGADRAAVEQRLPRFDHRPGPIPGEPPAPPGADCRYYLTEGSGGRTPLYRLCFAGGVLVDKDVVARE